MMDPGWLSGSRSQRGPEDQGTFDGGNDPVGVVRRYVWLILTMLWFEMELLTIIVVVMVKFVDCSPA